MGGKSRILGLFGPKYGFQGGFPPPFGAFFGPKSPQQGGTPALGGGRASIAIFFIAIEAKSRFWPFFALFWQKMAKNGSGRNGMGGENPELCKKRGVFGPKIFFGTNF